MRRFNFTGRKFNAKIAGVEYRNTTTVHGKISPAMRPITKIFLLIVVAFVVYLLWPRTPSLKNFDPAALANLSVKTWEAEKAHKGFDALMDRYQIYTSQYHFSPVAAFRMAQSQGAAISSMANAKQSGGDPGSDDQAVHAFTEKFTFWKTDARANIDPDSIARDEVAWRSMEMDGSSKPEEIAAPLTRVLAAIYGGSPADFTDVANELVDARGMILGNQTSDGADPRAEAQVKAQDAFKLLHDIALTPPATQDNAQQN